MRNIVALHALADDLAMDQIGGFFRGVSQKPLRIAERTTRIRSR